MTKNKKRNINLFYQVNCFTINHSIFTIRHSIQLMRCVPFYQELSTLNYSNVSIIDIFSNKTLPFFNPFQVDSKRSVYTHIECVFGRSFWAQIADLYWIRYFQLFFLCLGLTYFSLFFWPKTYFSLDFCAKPAY